MRAVSNSTAAFSEEDFGRNIYYYNILFPPERLHSIVGGRSSSICRRARRRRLPWAGRAVEDHNNIDWGMKREPGVDEKHRVDHSSPYTNIVANECCTVLLSFRFQYSIYCSTVQHRTVQRAVPWYILQYLTAHLALW